MDSTILGAIIGAFATILAAIITAIVAYAVTHRKKKEDTPKSEYAGEWIAEWIPDEDGEITETRVNLTAEPNDQFKGQGEGGLSTYAIEGFDSPFAAAFSYRGLDLHKKNIVGVFIVKKWPDERMEGSWYQLSANNMLEHGKVILRRP